MPVKYVGDKNTDGVSLGQSTTDKVHLYGGTPVVQAATITALTAGSTLPDVITAVTALLVAVKNIGLISPT
jgi:hypothetical protein